MAQPKAPLLVAGLDQLDEILRQHYADIETLNATVDMEPAVLSASKGEIANYKEVRGYILLRKPAWIRVIGLYPVVRSTAFDMVSDGQDFRLYLPGRNLFLEGPDRLERPSPNKLENLPITSSISFARRAKAASFASPAMCGLTEQRCKSAGSKFSIPTATLSATSAIPGGSGGTRACRFRSRS